MIQIRCIAVDDEPIALEKLEGYIRRVPFLELVALCENPVEAVQVVMEQRVDALFVDINMPDLNGMELVFSLPEPPMVVFTTAYAEYAVESYRIPAVDYLLKPFDFADFQRAAGRLLKQTGTLQAVRLAVHAGPPFLHRQRKEGEGDRAYARSHRRGKDSHRQQLQAAVSGLSASPYAGPGEMMGRVFYGRD